MTPFLQEHLMPGPGGASCLSQDPSTGSKWLLSAWHVRSEASGIKLTWHCPHPLPGAGPLLTPPPGVSMGTHISDSQRG